MLVNLVEEAVVVAQLDVSLDNEREQLARLAAHQLALTPDTLPDVIQAWVDIPETRPSFKQACAELLKACWLFNHSSEPSEAAVAGTDLRSHFPAGLDVLAPYSAPVTVREAPATATRICPECGTEFKPTKPSKVFCKDTCRNRHHARRGRDDAKALRAQQKGSH